MERASDIQRRFGAKIDVKLPPKTDRQLFVILGAGPKMLAGRIAGVEGRLVLGGTNWVRAEMSFPQAMAMRGIPGVRGVAGVSMDPERLAKLRQAMKAS